MTSGRTYLDYNATAPLRAQAQAAMLAALDLVGNPSSVHAEGRRARSSIESAREAVASLVGARAADVVFTSGASEANATVIAGGWDTIFVSGLEHDSVLVSARRSGARVVDLPVTSAGTITAAGFAQALETAKGSAGLGRALCGLQLANNETGVIHDVAAVAAVAKAHGVRVLCDATQAPGRMPIACNALGADYLTLSSHKLGGPQGAGALVVVDGAPQRSLIAGGGQERGRRAGTENVAAIVGFGAAARLALQDLDGPNGVTGLRELRDRLERGIAALTPQAVVVAQAVQRLPNTSCVALPGVPAEITVIRLDLAGVAISAGAACSSGKVGKSTVLTAIGLDAALARTAVRVSIGHATTAADIATFLAAWAAVATAQQRAA